MANEAAHALDVLAQRLDYPLIRKRIEPRAQDRQGGLKFVCGIGGKFLLNAKASFETIKRLIYRPHKVANFTWHRIDRQANIGARGTDTLCLFRRLQQWSQRPAKDDDVDGEQ